MAKRGETLQARHLVPVFSHPLGGILIDLSARQMEASRRKAIPAVMAITIWLVPERERT
jgi:hypothetical protein